MVITSRRERNRLATLSEIKTTARAQMAERGAAGLSLREVARQMGLSSAAIYRYFANRDDLVTALIVDAFTDLGGALDDADAALSPDDLFGRFVALAVAYRGWALAHPGDYALIFGTPIPGYHAPPEITQAAAQRGMGRFVEVALTAHRQGRGRRGPGAGEARSDPNVRDLPPDVRAMALASWGQMHGLVSLELFGHLDSLGVDPAALYRNEVVAMAEREGLGRGDS